MAKITVQCEKRVVVILNACKFKIAALTYLPKKGNIKIIKYIALQ